MVRVWQRRCVATEGAIVYGSIRHGARTRLAELASGKGEEAAGDEERVSRTYYIIY